MTANKLEGKARELLADYFSATERPWTASLVRQNKPFEVSSADVVSAIARALDTARQSSAAADGGWRPVSESPEVGQMVAVHAPGAMLSDIWPARWNGHNFDAGGGWFEQDEVTGWQPLPTARQSEPRQNFMGKGRTIAAQSLLAARQAVETTPAPTPGCDTRHAVTFYFTDKDAAEQFRTRQSEGMVLVPRVPTEAMLQAAVTSVEGNAVYKVMSAGGLAHLEETYADVYAAMLAAAAPQAGKGDEGG